MPSKVSVSTLQASSIDILNVIRNNASPQYQDKIPVITKATDIPKVGQTMEGYPALANEAVQALMGRIAFVAMKSATFNNVFRPMKKGFLSHGETIEDVFVEIAKVYDFDANKAPQRELKRYASNVHAVFHAVNWKVLYPLTIDQEEYRHAFLSEDGVVDLITKLIDQIFQAYEYDEYLLFKYLIIKGVTHGDVKPIGVDLTNIKNAGKAFRATSSQFTFMKRDYNLKGVLNNTPKERQHIFIDSNFEADYDVDVLASAFNLNKADYIGQRTVIDSFTTFDNERFEKIREASDMIDEVTAEELALMADVKAVLVDTEWFQVYDNLAQMEEDRVGSGLYWNYFYHSWKVVSTSPFANAVAFVDSSSITSNPNTINFKVVDKSEASYATVLTLGMTDSAELRGHGLEFIQTEDATEDGIAIHKYGAIIIPADKSGAVLEVNVNGDVYVSATNTDGYAEYTVSGAEDVGDTILFVKKSLMPD